MVPASAYAVQQRSRLVSDFVFRLGQDGRFAYDAAYDISRGGFLAGNGTLTIELQGYPPYWSTLDPPVVKYSLQVQSGIVSQSISRLGSMAQWASIAPVASAGGGLPWTAAATCDRDSVVSAPDQTRASVP